MYAFNAGAHSDVQPATPAAGASMLDEPAASSILWKAFLILELFCQDRSQLSLSQISRRSELPKSTAHRVIGMLVELEALERVGVDYRLGPKIFSLATRSREIEIGEVARSHVQALAGATGQIVHLATLKHLDVLYLEKVGDTHHLSPVSAGDRLGAHMTAVGKAMLAFSGEATIRTVLRASLERRTSATITDPRLLATALSGVRITRLATDSGGARTGLNCIASPILSGDRAVAAVSVAFPTSVGSGHAFIPALQEATTRITHALQLIDRSSIPSD